MRSASPSGARRGRRNWRKMLEKLVENWKMDGKFGVRMLLYVLLRIWFHGIYSFLIGEVRRSRFHKWVIIPLTIYFWIQSHFYPIITWWLIPRIVGGLQPWWFQWDKWGQVVHSKNWGELTHNHDLWVVHHQVVCWLAKFVGKTWPIS